MNNIKSVEVRWEDRSVGRLAMTREGLCAFEYSAEQLASGALHPRNQLRAFELEHFTRLIKRNPVRLRKRIDGRFGALENFTRLVDADHRLRILCPAVLFEFANVGAQRIHLVHQFQDGLRHRLE